MKFGLVSPVLPPSKSGQAMIINKLLKDTTSSNYFLISRQDYTNNQNNTYYSNKLSGKYYSLPTYDNYIFIKAINKIKEK